MRIALSLGCVAMGMVVAVAVFAARHGVVLW